MRKFHLGTFDMVFWIAGLATWSFCLFGVTMAGGYYGLIPYAGGTLAIVYVRHPRRREHQEYDDKKIPTPERHTELVNEIVREVREWEKSKARP